MEKLRPLITRNLDKESFDYIIVGQGIAGSLLSYNLLKSGMSCLVIDNGNPNAASKVASGIINPVTGRRFVKSWMFDQLWNKAISLYVELEELLNVQLFHRTTIIRALWSIAEENQWYIRTIDPDYTRWMIEKPASSDYQGIIKPAFSYGEVHSARVALPLLMTSYREWLRSKSRLWETDFGYSDLKIGTDTVVYQNVRARHIVFCEGWRVLQNPLFKQLPFAPAKGEVLIVRIPNLKTNKLLKQDLFFVSVGESLYWVGSTNEWDDLNENITVLKRKELEKKLNKILICDYTIIAQKAGVRPSSQNRRPLMGTHFQFKNVHIFNGLGTKGASLAPFWSDHMAKYLVGKVELERSVDILNIEKGPG